MRSRAPKLQTNEVATATMQNATRERVATRFWGVVMARLNWNQLDESDRHCRFEGFQRERRTNRRRPSLERLPAVHLSRTGSVEDYGDLTSLGLRESDYCPWIRPSNPLRPSTCSTRPSSRVPANTARTDASLPHDGRIPWPPRLGQCGQDSRFRPPLEFGATRRDLRSLHGSPRNRCGAHSRRTRLISTSRPHEASCQGGICQPPQCSLS